MQIIGYVRVSTQKQGDSGLGLEAQLSTLDQYVKNAAGELVQTYREVESGDDAERPQLARAIAHAKRLKCKLVIAKLDRLARNVHFISGLMETGVDFVNAESPNDDRFVTHIKAAVAEEELRKIKQRTRDALAAAKRRGALLGSARPGHWDGHESQRLAGATKGGAAYAAKVRKESAATYMAVLPLARQLREQGESFQAVADRLNAAGHATLKGMPWNKMQVSRLLAASN